MNARDKLLQLVDEGLLDANDILHDLLVNYFDLDTANDAAESELTDNGFDDYGEDEDDDCDEDDQLTKTN